MSTEAETVAKTAPDFNIKAIVDDILDSIEKEREREIIARRFGLHGPNETLEEIGNYLGITRERVRQIEKQVLTRMETIKVPHLERVNNHFKLHLEELGQVAPIQELVERFQQDKREENPKTHEHVNFLATLAPDIEVIGENDDFHHSLAMREHHDHKLLKVLLDELTTTIEDIGEPAALDEVHGQMKTKLDRHHVHGLARSAKQVTDLDNKWGKTDWPLVNPKSIRDKIYIVLQREDEPMHFRDIATAIKTSNFKRSDVTTQAIHNELIKDDRFVLVGRGIYALKEWGYKSGTVADIIEDVLEQDSPLERDEIVKRVLKQRHVKPTTVILNLQGKDKFKRVDKSTYELAG